MSAEYRMSIAVDASGASSGVDNVAKAFANLEKYLSSMDRTLTGIESALSNTGSVSSQLSSSLDSTAKSADSAQKGLKNAAKSADELANQSGQAAKTQKDLATAFEKVALAAGVAFTATSFAIKGSVTAAVDFEKSMAGVKKVIDFENPAQFKQMEQDIIALSQRLPMAATDIAAIMEAAGQSGIARDELSRFAESAIKMGVAFDITAEEAGKAMAEMRASFGMSQTEVETLADQINYLGNNSTNSAPQIMEVVQRIGSLAETANISSSTLAALSASMVGVAPEVAATSLKNFSLQLVKGESLSKSAKNAFKTMGLDYKQVAQDMQKDSEGTIRKVLEAAQKVPEHMRAAVLNDAFGSESIAAISQLVTNYETVDKNLKAMGDSATYAGSMLKEFEGMSGTSAAQMQLFDNNIQAVKIAFGAAFLPAINQVMTALTPVLKTIAQWVQENPKLASTIIAVSTGLLGLVAGLGAVVAILPTMAAGWALLSAGMAAVSLPILGIVAGIAAVIAIGVLLYKNWDEIKAKASEIWNGIKETVSNAWESIKSFFSGDSFSGIWDGIKNGASTAWEWIKSIVSGAWDGIKAYFTGSGDFLSSVWESVKSGVSGAWDSIKQAIVNKFNEIKQAFFDWLGGQPAPVQEMVSNIISIFTGLVGGIGAIWDLISSGASTAWEGIKSIASGAIDFISNAWNGIKDGASSAWESVKSTASSAFDAVKGYASEKLGQAKTVVSNIASDIGTAWDKAKDGASKAFDNVKSAISEKLNGAKSEATKAMEGVKSAIASSGVGEAFSKGFDSAKNAVSSSMNGIRTVVTAGITAVKAMIQLNVTTFAIVFNIVFNSIKTIVQTAFGVIKGIVTGDIGAVKSAISNGLSQLAGIARNAITQMVSAFKSAGAQMRGVGGDIMQGLINGVKAKIGEFLSTIRNMASQGLATLRGVMRTASPSKATREIGEWVSEGLAIGIDDKAVMPIKSAKDTGQKVLEAYKNELEGLERDIYLNHLKAQGNPFAEFTADLKFGKKYQGLSKEELAVLEHKIKHKETSANIASYAEEIRNIDAEIAKIGKGKLELMELEYETTRKYIGLSREDFELLKRKTVVLETRKFVEESTAKIKDQIATLGMNEFELLKHQLSTAKEYQAVTEETKNHHVETVKALKQQEALLKSQKDLERATTIAKNVGDKYAGMRYDLQQQGFDQSTIDGIVSNQEKTDVATAFGQWQADQKQAMLNSDPALKLQAEHDQKMEMLKKFNEAELLLGEDFNNAKKKQEEEFNEAMKELRLTQGAQVLSSLTSIAKDAFGEQSKAYKVMFAMEKGMAIARSIMAIQTALASASASAPFPANLGVMATVAAQTASIIGNIKAVTMPVGQAHDGIMSVPKSGTWNLEKGERVLPKHTAKALDDKLDGMGSGGVNITINVASDGSSTTDAQGANQTAKAMADRIKTVVLETLRQERKQGGLLYA